MYSMLTYNAQDVPAGATQEDQGKSCSVRVSSVVELYLEKDSADPSPRRP